MKVIQLFKDDSQLIRRASKGNREAQQKLFARHCGKMLSVCRQYVRDLHHAEEVMLDGFFKVFKHLKDYKGEGSFEGWMRRIMVREAISFLRKQKRMEFPEPEIRETGPFWDHLNADMNAAHIQELIDSLPEGYRTVFLMYAVDGYKHSEIANMLKISEGTSKSQLHKARTLLQRRINKENKSGYGSGKI